MKQLLTIILITIATHAYAGGNSSITAVTETGGYGRFMTIKHDGHKYIVFQARMGVSMIHSPSCYCKGNGNHGNNGNHYGHDKGD